MWFLAAVLNPILHGAANILDNYISSKYFKNISTLLFYSALFDLLFLPIIFNNVDWVTGLTFASLASFFIIILTAFIPVRRRDITKEFPLFKKVALLFGAEELLTFSGSASITYALSLAPVTVVEAIGSSQPFFVLVYALIFGKFFPKLFREKVDSKNIARKILLFTIMIIGVILVMLSE